MSHIEKAIIHNTEFVIQDKWDTTNQILYVLEN